MGFFTVLFIMVSGAILAREWKSTVIRRSKSDTAEAYAVAAAVVLMLLAIGYFLYCYVGASVKLQSVKHDMFDTIVAIPPERVALVAYATIMSLVLIKLRGRLGACIDAGRSRMHFPSRSPAIANGPRFQKSFLSRGSESQAVAE